VAFDFYAPGPDGKPVFGGRANLHHANGVAFLDRAGLPLDGACSVPRFARALMCQADAPESLRALVAFAIAGRASEVYWIP